jgi:hypothetical protein
MRRRASTVLAAMGIAILGAATSCSDSNDDSVGRACRVIVRDCHVMSNESDCIDVIGDVASYEADCVDCIAHSGCTYFSDCQRSVAGCRLPTDIQP